MHLLFLLCTYLLLFNFQWPFAAFLCDSFNSISQTFSFVNTFFESFLSFFQLFFFRFSHPSSEHLTILPLSYYFVKHFFCFFISLHTLTDFEYIYSTLIVTFVRSYEKSIKNLRISFPFYGYSYSYNFNLHFKKDKLCMPT